MGGFGCVNCGVIKKCGLVVYATLKLGLEPFRLRNHRINDVISICAVRRGGHGVRRCADYLWRQGRSEHKGMATSEGRNTSCFWYLSARPGGHGKSRRRPCNFGGEVSVTGPMGQSVIVYPPRDSAAQSPPVHSTAHHPCIYGLA